MKKVPAFSLPWRRRSKKASQKESSATPFYVIWDSVARFAAEIRASNFMAEMIRRRDAYGSEGVMGAPDCATLYGLTRWLRPAVVVESGGVFWGWAGFLFKKPRDEKVPPARPYSIEMR